MSLLQPGGRSSARLLTFLMSLTIGIIESYGVIMAPEGWWGTGALGDCRDEGGLCLRSCENRDSVKLKRAYTCRPSSPSIYFAQNTLPIEMRIPRTYLYSIRSN